MSLFVNPHLSKLEEGGLVQVEKSFPNKRPQTMIAITVKGKQAIEDHWRRLENLRNGARSWESQE